MLSILETDNASFLTFLLGQSDDPSLNIKKKTLTELDTGQKNLVKKCKVYLLVLFRSNIQRKWVLEYLLTTKVSTDEICLNAKVSPRAVAIALTTNLLPLDGRKAQALICGLPLLYKICR